jgi:hypothetical protein
MMKGRLFALVMIFGGVTFLFGAAEAMSAESPLIDGEGVQIVNAQCGACHSLALVAQNRADRAGWRALIRWMQAPTPASANARGVGRREAVVANATNIQALTHDE